MLIEAVGEHLDREQHKSQHHPKTFVISSKKFEELLKSLSNIKAKGGYFQASYNCTNSVFLPYYGISMYFCVFAVFSPLKLFVMFLAKYNDMNGFAQYYKSC